MEIGHEFNVGLEDMRDQKANPPSLGVGENCTGIGVLHNTLKLNQNTHPRLANTTPE